MDDNFQKLTSSVDVILTQLQQQIELAAKLNNYTFINEIGIENFIKNVICTETDTNSKFYNKNYRNHINSLLSYLVYLSESNDNNPNKLWLIHCIILKFIDSMDKRNSLEEIVSSPEMIQKINLLADKDFINLSILCAVNLISLQPYASDFYKRMQNEIITEDSDLVQSLSTKLRNSLYQDSINTSLVLNILSKAYEITQLQKGNANDSKVNIFDKIYSQTLIHALKNQNKHLMMQIFLRCPDGVFNDENLVKQIIDSFRTPNDQTDLDFISLYSYALFCSNSKLIKFISSSRRNYLYSEYKSHTFFDLKQCFLLALQEKKHFLKEFINFHYQNQDQDDWDLSMSPIKSQIFIYLLSFYNIVTNHNEDVSHVQEKFSKLESKLCDLFGQIESIVPLDETFLRIVEKIQFVFKFADWCYNHINYSNVEKFNFRHEIIAQLMIGSSPLKILSNHDFFELKIRNISFNTFNEEIVCDYVCDLIEKFDRNVSMILKGFIVIRLVLFCIFSKEKENIYFDTNKLQSLLRVIYPIHFRVEIMEDLFSLLFLTKNDLKNDHSFNSEDEDYLDETINSSNIKSENSISDETQRKTEIHRSKFHGDFSRTFICPNWIIPKLLEVLKDMLYKTNSELFNRSYTYDDKNQNISMDNQLKNRINTLLKYVNDAQFRYDVIRPAFFKSSMDFQETTQNSNDNSESIWNDQNENCYPTISTSSETENKNHLKRDASLISCMLASHTQLLCYTLTENRIDSSRQICKLFEDDLKNSKPYKELQLLDYFTEFHNQVCNVQSHFSESVSLQRQLSKDSNKSQSTKNKIDEITSLGIRSSRIQSLLYEMLMKMDSIEIETKIIFMLDYALSSSPSLEIAQSILESVFIHNQNLSVQQKKILPDKIENFVIEIQKFIKNLAPHVDIGNISMSEYLEKSITYPSILDTQTLINNTKTEIKLCEWYYKFYSLMNDFERQIIENPNSMSSINCELQEKANQLNYYYDQLMTHCPLGKYQYLKALYLYVCKVNKALIECRKRNIPSDKNTIDASIICSQNHFSILKQSPSAILCSMVIKSKISPKIIDDLAQVMKVNLIGVLCSVFCPTIISTFLPDSNIDFTILQLCQPSLTKLIELYFQDLQQFKNELTANSVSDDHFSEEKNPNVFEKSLDNSFQPVINQDVLNYFYSKCSVLVDILYLLKLVDESQMSLINTFSPSLQIFPDSPLIRWIELIKKNFYFGDISSTLILAFYARIPAGQNVVIKTLEHYISNKNYLKVYKLFQYIEDFSANHQRSFSPNKETYHNSFEIFQNAIYSALAFIKEDAKYVFQIIKDPKMKTNLILSLLDSFEIYDQTFYATRLIRLGLQSILDDEKTYGMDTSECQTKLKINLKKIEFYASVGQLTGLKTWKSAKNNLQSVDILSIIKSRKRYSLAIDWYEINGFENETTDLLIELLIYAYSESSDYVALKKLFQMFLEEPKFNNVIIITEKILNQADNLDLRTFLVDFLIQYYRKCNSYLIVDQYERYKLGVEITKLLSRKIQQDYIDLIPSPQLLIEQLLMNSEIESLEKVINQSKLFKADELIEKYAQKSVYIELYDSNSFDGSDMTIISSESSQTTNKSIIQFVAPPKVPPSKEQWVSDTSKTHCMLCQIVRFSMINRRHHCRRCGRVVCNGCSSNSLLISEINPNIPVRVCDDCFNWHNKVTRKISTQSIESSMWNSQAVFKRTQWKLSLLDPTNQSRRNEFSYESAPSVSLCLAILRLHSNKTKCCKFIIDKICAPLIESTSSSNVDSTLLIEMIRSLLISTRLAFEEDANQSDDPERQDSSAEIEQLNLYLDRLDVIRMLINANYFSKEIIGYVLNNNIQKLQEKLLEAEQFELTIDIAKKYGIESSPIWKSWALICLKHFHFVEARQKFIRYFDQVKRFSEVQQTLKMIIAMLVSINWMNLQSISLKDKCSQIISGQFNFLTENVPLSSKISFSVKSNQTNLSQHLKPRILQEIVYYLETYGSKENQLQFYVEHFYWKEAIECFFKSNKDNISANKVTANFLQKIFIPAQVNGHLSELFVAIRLCDQQQPQLLWSCLMCICKYLDKNRLYHSLYRVQVYMNDYLRAAITQINHFFLNRNNEFEEQANDLVSAINLNGFSLLYGRMNHLEKARDYCNMYLHNIDYVKMKQGCLVVDKKDVFKQIRLIELQMDILKRFNKNVHFPITVRLFNEEDLEHYFMEWITAQQQGNSMNVTKLKRHPLFLSAYVLCLLENKLNIQIGRLSYPPTLLEHDSIRKSLITALVILYFDSQQTQQDEEDSPQNNKNIEEGFRCALRIIQDHQLQTELVFKMATMFLVAHYLEWNATVEQISNDLKQLLTCVHSCSSSSSSSTSPSQNAKRMISEDISMTSAIAVDGDDDPEKFIIVDLNPNMTLSPTLVKSLSDDIIDDCLGFIETIMSVLSRMNNNHQNQISFSTGLSRVKLSELKECLIKLISDDTRRIEAYLNVGKLKLAYLLAASIGQRDNILKVLHSAKQANDQNYIKICEMWLKKNSKINQ